MVWTLIIVVLLINIFGYGLGSVLNTKEYQDEKKNSEGFRYLGEVYGRSKLFEQYKQDRFKDVKAYMDSGYAPVVHADKNAYLVEDLQGNTISTDDLSLEYDKDLNVVFGMIRLDTTVYHVTMWYYFTLLKTIRDGYFGQEVMEAVNWQFSPWKAFATYNYLFGYALECIDIMQYGRRFHKEPDTKLSAYFREIGLTHEHLIELKRSSYGFNTSISLHGERGSEIKWLFHGQVDFEAIRHWGYKWTPWEGEQHSRTNMVYMCAIIDEISRREQLSYEDAKRKVFEVALEI